MGLPLHKTLRINWKKMVNKKDNSAFREILSFHLFVSLPLSPILPNLCTYIPTYLGRGRRLVQGWAEQSLPTEEITWATRKYVLLIDVEPEKM